MGSPYWLTDRFTYRLTYGLTFRLGFRKVEHGITLASFLKLLLTDFLKRFSHMTHKIKYFDTARVQKMTNKAVKVLVTCL